MITLHVPGMTCGHCEAAVKEEVGKVAGVADVSVDLATGFDVATDTIADRVHPNARGAEKIAQRWAAVPDHYDLPIETRLVSGATP